jgi:hypothetical protein
MWEGSCGSMMPAIIIVIIYYVLTIDLSFSVCSGSMREASCGSIMPE